MSADPWNLAVWPSPTPEEEVRERVRARTRTIRRRRRMVPLVGLAAVALLGVAALPDSRPAVSVAADGGGSQPPEAEAEPEPSPGNSTGSPSAGGASVRNATGRRTDAPAPKQPEGAAPSQSPAPTLPPLKAQFPTSPHYSGSHPLLADQEGDAWVTVAATGRGESDPTVDITRLDVTADHQSVTGEIKVLDMTRRPRTSFHNGNPTSLDFKVLLQRPEGQFTFHVRYRVSDGTVTASGTFRRPKAEAGPGGSYDVRTVDGVTGTVDRSAGIARVTAPFEAMNRVIVGKGSHVKPIDTGATVVPTGEAGAHYTHTYDGSAIYDTVKSDNPDFAYRLGD